MALNLTNEDAVRRYLQSKLQIVVETILENIKKENVEEINRIVYGAGSPSVYERTYEFRDSAWDSKITSSTPYETIGEFKYEPNGMNNPHSSHVTGEDVRPYLAEIIYEGLAGHIYGIGFWTNKRDAWTALVKVVGSNTMKKWIKEGTNKAGLKISWD